MTQLNMSYPFMLDYVPTGSLPPMCVSYVV